MVNKKIIGILIILSIMLTACGSIPQGECNTDSDCVPATCCHADACVPISEAPDCEDVVCSMECVPGTMDCGQGECRCINNICEAVIY